MFIIRVSMRTKSLRHEWSLMKPMVQRTFSFQPFPIGLLFWVHFPFFSNIYYVGRCRIGCIVQTCSDYMLAMSNHIFTKLPSPISWAHWIFVGWRFHLLFVSGSSLFSRRCCRFRSFVCMVAPWKQMIGNGEWLGLVAQAGAIQMSFRT